MRGDVAAIDQRGRVDKGVFNSARCVFDLSDRTRTGCYCDTLHLLGGTTSQTPHKPETGSASGSHALLHHSAREGLAVTRITDVAVFLHAMIPVVPLALNLFDGETSWTEFQRGLSIVQPR